MRHVWPAWHSGLYSLDFFILLVYYSRSPAAKASPSDGEGDEQFEAMASEVRKQKAQKKQRMKDKARLFMPTVEEEVKGQRGEKVKVIRT